MGSMDKTYFYKDKPLFGLDVGFSSIKVMQIEWPKKRPLIKGYGIGEFDPACIKNGVIVNHEVLANAVLELFKTSLTGHIDSRRVAMTIPVSKTYNRPVKMPKLNTKELDDAIQLEAERYIPMPLSELYVDYSVVSQSEKDMDVFMVAAPRRLVDSYMDLAKLLNLDVVAIETTIAAGTRVLVKADRSDVPTILIDFGARSVDISIFDNALIVTGTVPGGSDDFTSRIAEKLNVSSAEAFNIKTEFGIDPSKKQAEITESVTPILTELLKEIRRVLRYYESRYSNNRKIGQIVTMGGGANMPGLSEYMTNALRLPVRMSDPWQIIKFGKLPPPNEIHKSMFITVAGSSLTQPKEIFV